MSTILNYINTTNTTLVFGCHHGINQCQVSPSHHRLLEWGVVPVIYSPGYTVEATVEIRKMQHLDDKISPWLGNSPVTLLPSIFGVQSYTVEHSSSPRIKILVLGTYEQSRRNYGLLKQLQNVQLAHPIEIILFPVSDVTCSKYIFDKSMNSNISISCHGGGYQVMYQLVLSASFIATLIDATISLHYDSTSFLYQFLSPLDFKFRLLVAEFNFSNMASIIN
mmetsp:Transcript_2398/g.3213  ORF Transcript_2398/g.3213 Transcript_2398/m.3213 type:complete len:222 (-) Transcript_2398:1321-1986(-)